MAFVNVLPVDRYSADPEAHLYEQVAEKNEEPTAPLYLSLSVPCVEGSEEKACRACSLRFSCVPVIWPKLVLLTKLATVELLFLLTDKEPFPRGEVRVIDDAQERYDLWSRS